MQDKKLRAFKLKLFLNELPSLYNLNLKYPNTHIPKLCISREIYKKTTIHIFSCNNNFFAIRTKAIIILIDLIRHNIKLPRDTITAQSATHLVKCLIFQIDPFCTYSFETTIASPFSIIDLIRGLTPKTLIKKNNKNFSALCKNCENNCN